MISLRIYQGLTVFRQTYHDSKSSTETWALLTKFLKMINVPDRLRPIHSGKLPLCLLWNPIALFLSSISRKKSPNCSVKRIWKDSYEIQFFQFFQANIKTNFKNTFLKFSDGTFSDLFLEKFDINRGLTQ